MSSKPGWNCTGGSLTSATICLPICGDGLKVGNEVCDDGNTISGDGCAGNCMSEEPGWVCESKAGEPISTWSSVL